MTTTVSIKGVMHEVFYYNDDTGHGMTKCERPVLPCDATLDGDVGCSECKAADKTSERRDA